MKKIKINNIIKESFILSSFVVFNSRVEEIYSASLAHRLLSRFSQRLKEIFRQSFLWRLAAIKRSEKNYIFDHSVIIKAILPILKRVTDRFSLFFSESLTQRLFKDCGTSFKKESRFIGYVIIIALLVNLFLVLIFNYFKILPVLGEKTHSLGIWFKLLLLILGLAFLFCNKDFNSLKKSSYFYKRFVDRKPN